MPARDRLRKAWARMVKLYKIIVQEWDFDFYHPKDEVEEKLLAAYNPRLPTGGMFRCLANSYLKYYVPELANLLGGCWWPEGVEDLFHRMQKDKELKEKVSLYLDRYLEVIGPKPWPIDD